MADKQISGDRLVRTIRLDDDRIASILDELDEASLEPSSDRKHDRYQYRIKGLVVHMRQSELAEPIPYLVPGRNISAGGLSFLHGGFVYPGTKCLVQLITTYGTWTNITGKITRCRYLKSNIHEVSMSFDQELDPSVYCAEAVTRRVLLVEDDESIVKIARFYLEQLHANVDLAINGKVAVEKALRNKYDVILMDMDLPIMDGFEATKTLREQGYAGIIVAATSLTQKDDQKKSFEAGCDKYLAKPFNRNDLAALLESIRGEPLFSNMHDDPTMSELIHEFVMELPVSTREIGEATAGQDAKQLEAVVRKLKGRAASFGFDEITEYAEKIETNLIQNGNIELVQDDASKLSKLCLQARSPIDIPGSTQGKSQSQTQPQQVTTKT